MELELGLGLPCATMTSEEAVDLKEEVRCSDRKRRYEEAFEKTATLPLFDGCDEDGSDGSDGEVADSCNDDCEQVFYHSR